MKENEKNKEVDEILASVRASDKSPEERESQGEHEGSIARKILDFKEEFVEMTEGIKNDYIRYEDLQDNPQARVPVCLCLDTSGSMYVDPIDELNKGVELFCEAIKDDTIAKYSVEICVVVFGGERARCLSDFATLDRKPNLPQLKAYGPTPMGDAVQMGLDLLERRKQDYKSQGVDYYQPWLVLMTDGTSTDSIEAAAKNTSELVNQNKLTILPIGIGDEANMSTLKKFSPKWTPLKLKGLNFREFFQWLSASVAMVSQSTTGDKIELDTEGIKSWADIGEIKSEELKDNGFNTGFEVQKAELLELLELEREVNESLRLEIKRLKISLRHARSLGFKS